MGGINSDGGTSQVPENPLDDRRCLDAGGVGQPAAALPAGVDIDGEHPPDASSRPHIVNTKLTLNSLTTYRRTKELLDTLSRMCCKTSPRKWIPSEPMVTCTETDHVGQPVHRDQVPFEHRKTQELSYEDRLDCVCRRRPLRCCAGA